MQKRVLKDRGFAFRYPKTYVGLTSGVCMLVLFSKPIYDFFFNPNPPKLEDLKKDLALHRSQR